MRQAGLDGLPDIHLATREEDGALPVLLCVDGHEILYHNLIDGRLGRSTWPLLLINRLGVHSWAETDGVRITAP